VKLKTIAAAVGIKIEDESFHDALYDVRITMEIFERILSDNTIKKYDEQKMLELHEELLQLDCEGYTPRQRSFSFLMD
jgi:DNA polymerase III epsilon subunit-like protein